MKTPSLQLSTILLLSFFMFTNFLFAQSSTVEPSPAINYSIMEFLGYTIKEWLFIVIIFLLLSGLIFATTRFEPRLVFFGVYLGISVILYLKFTTIFIEQIALYILLPSMVLGGLVGLMTYPDKVDVIFDAEFITTKGKKVIKNLRRGVLILGSAGSGKTESPIYSIMKHLAKLEFGGIIYDYKDGELSEMAKPLFGDRLRVIAIHKPYIGLRINPISAKYITDEKDINEVVNVIVDNLGSGGKPDFFTENASALLSAIILKFHLHHREYCTLPHIISFILAGDFEEKSQSQNLADQAEAKFLKLKNFLISDQRVAIQASPFIMGLASERQTAAVLSTLANSLRKLASPEIFWVLSGDDVSLDVNSYENDSVITILNEPKADSFLSPVIATIIHTATKQMMVRDRKQSFLLLDEAPTIKLRNMAKLPATMRSFGVCIIYCMQDLSQGVMQYGRDGIKEITSNLSTQFFGKTNDPETAKFYEGYFGMVKEKTKSISNKGSGSGGLLSSATSNTIGEREVSQVRAIEFFRLKAGQFAFLSDGKGQVVTFARNKIIKEKLDDSKSLTDEKYRRNYDDIIRQVNLIISSKIK
jgi:Type IV secretory system Conjugative DNA transfer